MWQWQELRKLLPALILQLVFPRSKVTLLRLVNESCLLMGYVSI